MKVCISVVGRSGVRAVPGNERDRAVGALATVNDEITGAGHFHDAPSAGDRAC
jgi:hypothetical protein